MRYIVYFLHFAYLYSTCICVMITFFFLAWCFICLLSSIIDICLNILHCRIYSFWFFFFHFNFNLLIFIIIFTDSHTLNACLLKCMPNTLKMTLTFVRLDLILNIVFSCESKRNWRKKERKSQQCDLWCLYSIFVWTVFVSMLYFNVVAYFLHPQHNLCLVRVL